MPKNKKAIPKTKGKYGNLPLPVDLIEELRRWKDSYELAWSDFVPDGERYKMTMEQLVKRLLEGVKRLDPEVWAVHEAGVKSREEQEEMMADFRNSFWEELYSVKKKLDGIFEGMEGMPAETCTTPKGNELIENDSKGREVIGMRYYFTNSNGDKLEALVGDKAAFYCKKDGRNVGMGAMLNDGWKLFNDAGVELTMSQAMKVSDAIKKTKTIK